MMDKMSDLWFAILLYGGFWTFIAVLILVPGIIVVSELSPFNSIEPPKCNGTWEHVGREEKTKVVDGVKYVTYREVVECKN